MKQKRPITLVNVKVQHGYKYTLLREIVTDIQVSFFIHQDPYCWIWADSSAEVKITFFLRDLCIALREQDIADGIENLLSLSFEELTRRFPWEWGFERCFTLTGVNQIRKTCGTTAPAPLPPFPDFYVSPEQEYAYVAPFPPPVPDLPVWEVGCDNAYDTDVCCWGAGLCFIGPICNEHIWPYGRQWTRLVDVCTYFSGFCGEDTGIWMLDIANLYGRCMADFLAVGGGLYYENTIVNCCGWKLCWVTNYTTKSFMSFTPRWALLKGLLVNCSYLFK